MKNNTLKRLLTLVAASALAFSITAGAAKVTDFTDVKTSNWYYNAVKYAADNNLFSGTTANTFSPNETMTRGMFVAVLGRFDGVDTGLYKGTAFMDVSAKSYVAPYAIWAKQQGITSGTGGNVETGYTFEPNASVTRQQIATMLYNYAKANDCDISANSTKYNSFADNASVSSYAKTAMQWATTHGIINGDNGKLNPKGNASRAEVAQMFLNAAELLKDKADDNNSGTDTGNEDNNQGGTDTGNTDTGNTGTDTGNTGNTDNGNDDGGNTGTTTPEETVYEMPTGKSEVDEQGGYYDYDLAKEIMIQINDLREDNGLEPLAFHPQIQEWAGIRAKECVVSYSHTRPNGTDCRTVGVGLSVENLMETTQSKYANGNKSTEDEASETIISWYNSQGHKTNMMGTSRKLGAVSCYIKGQKVYAAHLFSDKPMYIFEM